MASGCMSPNTIIPLPWRERNSIPHHGNEHTSQAQKVAKQGRHKSAGKRNHIVIIDEVEYRVGAFPYYPFRGHEVACRLLQPLWGRQRSTAQSYSHCWRELPSYSDTQTERREAQKLREGCNKSNPNTCWLLGLTRSLPPTLSERLR
eukprot:scaffold16587_cov141-Isochrysis_galbana.AAC.1